MRGDPFDLGGVKISGKEKTGSKKKLNKHDKTNTKKGGRNLMDKFGLYGSPLLYSVYRDAK